MKAWWKDFPFPSSNENFALSARPSLPFRFDRIVAIVELLPSPGGEQTGLNAKFPRWLGTAALPPFPATASAGFACSAVPSLTTDLPSLLQLNVFGSCLAGCELLVSPASRLPVQRGAWLWLTSIQALFCGMRRREISPFLMGNDPAIALAGNWLVRITLLVPLTHAQESMLVFSCPQSACFTRGERISAFLLGVQKSKSRPYEGRETLQSIDCCIVQEKLEL